MPKIRTDYPETLTTKVPREVAEFIRNAARAEDRSVSQWIRARLIQVVHGSGR